MIASQVMPFADGNVMGQWYVFSPTVQTLTKLIRYCTGVLVKRRSISIISRSGRRSHDLLRRSLDLIKNAL